MVTGGGGVLAVLVVYEVIIVVALAAATIDVSSARLGAARHASRPQAPARDRVSRVALLAMPWWPWERRTLIKPVCG